MGSETTPRLPLIDFNNLNLEAKSPNWELVKSQVYKALVEYGCFEAVFDKVPLHLRKAIFASLEELFDLPLETKLLNVSNKPYDGYIGQYPVVPLYESMAIEDANILEKVKSMTNILWPDGNKNFSENLHSFSEELVELDQIIRKMILESLGVEKYMEEHMNSSNYRLRAMKYKGPQTSDTKVGLTPHTDKNFVTILYQNQVEGLEMMTKDGQWISYKPSSDSFVVVIGDSIHVQLNTADVTAFVRSNVVEDIKISDVAAQIAWSNGRLHSPFHRVMMSGNEARYSAGLFSTPNGGYIIKAPEELVDDEHPLLFKPFDHAEFLKYYHSREGVRNRFAIQTYCGV